MKLLALRRATCVAASAIALVRLAGAQTPPDPGVELTFPPSPTAHRRDGFMMRIGWGPAHLYSRGHVIATPVDTGFSPSERAPPAGRAITDFGIAANLEFGGSIREGLVVGVDFASHMFADPEVEGQPETPNQFPAFDRECCGLGIRLLSFGGFVLFYPDPKLGLSSGLTVSSMTSYEADEGASGWAVAPQLGFDTWIGEQVSFGTFLRVTFARLEGEGTGDAVRKVTYNAALTTLGVALTYQ